jgi:hypothetical protein
MEEYPDLKIGDRVIRGPDWNYGDQDGFEENTDPLKYKGTIIKLNNWLDDSLWYRVEWDYSLFNNVYYYDKLNGKYDIILYVESKPLNLNPKPFFNFNFDLISI